MRGFDCPIPVVKTKKAMDELPGEEFRVVAKENVTWLAESRGYKIESEKTGADEFRLLLTPLRK